MGQHIRVTIGREGWYYIGMLGFIIAGAVIRDINLLYIMSGMMLGPLLLNVYLAIKSLKKIQFRRRCPPLVGVGDRLVVEVFATKPRAAPKGYAVEAQDRIARAGHHRSGIAHPKRLFFSQVLPDQASVASYRVTLYRRGRYEFGPLRITSGAPLGMIKATSTWRQKDQVLVSPQVGRLLPAWSRRLTSKDEGGQRSMRRVGASEGEFYGMRDWRNGDSRNWIHWRTSAKRAKLSVRQFEQRVNQDTVVILDLWQPKLNPEPENNIESAISFVATMAMEYGGQGSSHMMVAAAGRQDFLLKGTASPVFQRELLEQLAMIEPTTDDRLPELLAQVLPQVSAISKIVVVSTRSLDFADTDYFAPVWTQPRIRRLISEIICVDTTSDQFGEWFDIGPAATTPDRSDPQSSHQVPA